MVNQIFVNLAVADLRRAIDFFTALGFTFNPQWTDDTAACMVMGESIFAMLLTREKFQTFSPKPLVDPHQQCEVLVCVALESRAAVNTMIAKALAAGGSCYKPAEDYGFMYGHAFQDPDGHLWELIYLEKDGAS